MTARHPATLEAMTPLEEAAHRFIDTVETVFHSDWEYTLSYGLSADDPETGGKLTQIFGEEPVRERDGVTFLAPKMSPFELEAQNWGNYELFLDRYKALCAALGREPIV
jgi:hypothetical protein